MSTTSLVSLALEPQPSAPISFGNWPRDGKPKAPFQIWMQLKSSMPTDKPSIKDCSKLCQRWESACSAATTEVNYLRLSESDLPSFVITSPTPLLKSQESKFLSWRTKPSFATPKVTQPPQTPQSVSPMRGCTAGAETGKFMPSLPQPSKPSKLL